MRRLIAGAGLGAVAGLIDVIPMVIKKLPWNADLSAFTMWVVAGFFCATSAITMPAPLKGLVISFLCLIPSAIIIGSKEPASLIPIAVMTGILGSLLGWAVKKITGNCAG